MTVAEEYLGRSRLLRRLKNGPHGQLVELYAAGLVKEGLARQGAWRCLSLVGALLSWIVKSHSKLSELDERMVERYLECRARKPSIQPGDRAAFKWLLSVLSRAGMIAPAVLPPVTPQEQIFHEFGDYLRRDRRLAPKSIIRHHAADLARADRPEGMAQGADAAQRQRSVPQHARGVAVELESPPKAGN
jgi:hypothetical protein